MVIKYLSSLDLESNEGADLLECFRLVNEETFLLAGELYNFLLSEAGQRLMWKLRLKNKEIILFQADMKGRGFDLLRIVLSSRGLLLQTEIHGDFFESEVSCLYTCWFRQVYCEISHTKVFRKGKISQWIEREFRRLVRRRRR